MIAASIVAHVLLLLRQKIRHMVNLKEVRSDLISSAYIVLLHGAWFFAYEENKELREQLKKATMSCCQHRSC